MMHIAQTEKTVSFEKIFEVAENRVHAIFLFLSLLELVQQKFMKIMIGDGRNNFLIEYVEPEIRAAEMAEDGLTDEDFKPSFDDPEPPADANEETLL
jgi:segregation and condensation protein A